jgi:N-acetylmuramoyl-L-alanine amidase
MIIDRNTGLCEEIDNTTVQLSPNHGGHLVPDSIVLHYTAQTSTDGAVRSLSDPARKVSAHFVLGRDGELVQLVPLNKVAWHAGRSSWKGRSGYNKYSIGIEIVNAGPLVESPDETYRTWYKKVIPKDQVEYAGSFLSTEAPLYWHAYTKVQMDACWELCATLIEMYGIKEIVGHEEISPGRKTDPGPVFPLDRFRDRLLNSRDQDEEAEVDTQIEDLSGVVDVLPDDVLNVRSAPNTSGDKLGHLNKGTEVKILDTDGQWIKISTEGWVSGRHVK